MLQLILPHLVALVNYFSRHKVYLHIITVGGVIMKDLELTAAITAIANAIACGLSVNELALFAGIFVQLGDTLATVAARRALSEEKREE